MGVARRDARRDGRTFTIVVSVLVGLAAVPVLALVVLSGTASADGAPSSPVAPVLGILLASIPVVPLVLCYLWLDRYEPEPRVLLGLGLAWGACVACAVAVLVEGVGGWVTGWSDRAQLAVLAPFTEEACKGVFLVMLLLWRRHELDGVLDGIVYAGMVGIGFAFTENIFYLAAAYNGTDAITPDGSALDSTAVLTGTFIMRCLFSPFAHPFFTAFTGIGVGIAVGSRSGVVRVLAPLVGYLCAGLLHMCWNGSTVFGVGGFLLTYVVVMLPAFAGLVVLAIWARRSERTMLAASLGDAADRGLIPYLDVPWVVDLAARRMARQFARQYGGPAGEAAMKEYQQAAIELGFLHSRYLRGTAPPDFASRGKEYVARIGAVRPRIAFPGQVVTTR
ncbi:PrsW family intramembrane metalloprotease [Nocardioides sp. DS6]|uniref:PrsW family intramembrane metalloprotease n=1 Tax=Nocardioides eburneus TaxID=3231482 RepID=A0ABV3SZG9_9ACTN